MKNFLIVVSIFTLFISSCSTDFKVGADYKDVTVVYGLLSITDTAHYIKVTKGYYDEKENNLSLAKNPDSIYYNNLQVDMQVINNGNIVETIALNKVDLNNEGFPKEPGVFATTPNYAYKFKKNLDATKRYRLKVTNISSGKVITGETSLITNSTATFKFIRPSDETETLFLSNPVEPYVFIWRGPETAAFYDVVVRFKYQEVNLASPLDTLYYVKDIPVLKNVLSTTGELSATLSDIEFFKQLNSAIGDASINIKRYVDTPGLLILAGGADLKTYIDVNSAQGGITFDQIKPNYTNLQGENAFGILSTRGQIEFKKIKFADATINDIINSTYTRSLRFVGTSTK
jgi:hypothetical protein